MVLCLKNHGQGLWLVCSEQLVCTLDQLCAQGQDIFWMAQPGLLVYNLGLIRMGWRRNRIDIAPRDGYPIASASIPTMVFKVWSPDSQYVHPREIVRNTNSWTPYPHPAKISRISNSGDEAQQSHQVFWSTLKFKNYWATFKQEPKPNAVLVQERSNNG